MHEMQRFIKVRARVCLLDFIMFVLPNGHNGGTKDHRDFTGTLENQLSGRTFMGIWFSNSRGKLFDM